MHWKSLLSSRLLPSADSDSHVSQLPTPLQLGTTTTTGSSKRSFDLDMTDKLDDDAVAGGESDADDEPYQTSLHIAAERGHECIVDMLLASGAVVDAVDSEGNTPLHRATLKRKLDVVVKLLKHGANPNSVNTKGWTPVHIAVLTGSMELVGALVQHGGDLSKKARLIQLCDPEKYEAERA